MSGGYDLYGNWYSSEQAALNAELAQCASIDNERLAREQEHIYNLGYEQELRIQQLEATVAQLEQTVMYLLGITAPQGSHRNDRQRGDGE
jgi:hypothetical protein